MGWFQKTNERCIWISRDKGRGVVEESKEHIKKLQRWRAIKCLVVNKQSEFFFYGDYDSLLFVCDQV